MMSAVVVVVVVVTVFAHNKAQSSTYQLTETCLFIFGLTVTVRLMVHDLFVE